MAAPAPVKTLGLTAAALALGVVVGSIMSTAAAPTAPARAGDDPAIARLEQRVEALARRPSVSRVASAPAPEPPAGEPPPPSDVEPAPPPPAPADVAGALRDELAVQPRDPAWSADHETALRDALTTGPLAGATVAELECRSTACRVVLDFDDPAELHAVMTELPMHEAFEAGGFVHYTGTDDAPRTEIFVTRRGHDLPAAP